MRYDLIDMLPELAFRKMGNKLMTLEGGGGGKGAKAPPPPPPPAPPPQAEKAPDADILRSQNKARMSGGMSGGVAGTMLTGAGGVDPNALEIGKQTLLGG